LKAIGSVDKEGVCRISAILLKDRLPRALLISSDTEFNYYHMLVETLPKLALAEAADCPSDLPILMQGDIHPNLIDCVERAAKGRPVVYLPAGAAIHVDELWYVSDLSRVMTPDVPRVDETYDISVAPAAVREIRRRILGSSEVRKGTRKIYMSRSSHYRLLTNQDAFIDLLKQKGFEIIDTGAMSLQEQIDAMVGVSVIISPTGAALTNLLWCPEGVHALVLVADHPQMNLNIFNQIGWPLGIEVEFCMGNRVYQMEGRYSVHDNFEADLDVISTWCDRQSHVLA
jgi:capsular polysaccharide biosynthesis protein